MRLSTHNTRAHCVLLSHAALVTDTLRCTPAAGQDGSPGTVKSQIPVRVAVGVGLGVGLGDTVVVAVGDGEGVPVGVGVDVGVFV